MTPSQLTAHWLTAALLTFVHLLGVMQGPENCGSGAQHGHTPLAVRHASCSPRQHHLSDFLGPQLQQVRMALDHAMFSQGEQPYAEMMLTAAGHNKLSDDSCRMLKVSGKQMHVQLACPKHVMQLFVCFLLL